MTDNEIRSYLDKGGRLYNVNLIDRYRDGGTILIKCTGDLEFYVHQTDNTYHQEYPPSSENEIKNVDDIEFLKYKIKVYFERSIMKLETLKKLLNYGDN
jgi:hypothetical protein